MKDKLKAASLHITINLVLFSILLFVLLKLWYPAPFFMASGGLQGLKLVALVDIVLGPVLTFVIFNKAKKRRELLTDVSLIGILQIAAFIWGTWTVYTQRPVVAAFWEDSFFTVPAASLSAQSLQIEDLAQYGDQLPVYVYVDRTISEQRTDEIFAAMKNTQLAPYEIAELFDQYRPNMEKIAESSFDFDKISAEKTPAMQAQLEAILAANDKKSSDELLLIKLESKYRLTLIILEPAGEILGFLDVPDDDNSAPADNTSEPDTNEKNIVDDAAAEQ